jgi:hypothetical protein
MKVVAVHQQTLVCQLGQFVLATGPPPSIQTKRYQSWEKIADPAERRLAVVRLHAEGWIRLIVRWMDSQRWQKLTQAFPQGPLRGSRIVYDL